MIMIMIDRLWFSESDKNQLILVQMSKHYVVTVCRPYGDCSGLAKQNYLLVKRK